MADKFKIFTGNSSVVEDDVNRFLQTFEGTFSRMMMSGDEDNLVVGIVYCEEKDVKVLNW